MNTNNLTQTISLEPLFDTLKECGFTDHLATNEELKAIYSFFFRKIIHHETISIDFFLTFTCSDIIIEVAIAGQISHVDRIHANDPSLLTKKDILRIIKKHIDDLFRSTNDAVSREINLIKSK